MELLDEIFMFLEPLELLDGISFWSFWMSPCNGFLCLPALLEDPEDHKSSCLQNSVNKSVHCHYTARLVMIKDALSNA